eukprot:COSAG05_NODE_14760_length_387_cov_46.017361_1_plen_47_part_10
MSSTSQRSGSKRGPSTSGSDDDDDDSPVARSAPLVGAARGSAQRPKP